MHKWRGGGEPRWLTFHLSNLLLLLLLLLTLYPPSFSLSPFLSPFLSITLASRLDPSRFRSIFLSPRNLAVLCPDTVPPLTGRWLKGSIPSHRALWKELMDHRISVNALCADYPQSRVEIGFPINTFVIIYLFHSCFLFYPEFAYTFVS